eukprot:scaffold13569_cov87-Isochrysis_galbana.AAC.6
MHRRHTGPAAIRPAGTRPAQNSPVQNGPTGAIAAAAGVAQSSRAVHGVSSAVNGAFSARVEWGAVTGPNLVRVPTSVPQLRGGHPLQRSRHLPGLMNSHRHLSQHCIWLEQRRHLLHGGAEARLGGVRGARVGARGGAGDGQGGRGEGIGGGGKGGGDAKVRRPGAAGGGACGCGTEAWH